jgi:hypothetical protein
MREIGAASWLARRKFLTVWHNFPTLRSICGKLALKLHDIFQLAHSLQ